MAEKQSLSIFQSLCLVTPNVLENIIKDQVYSLNEEDSFLMEVNGSMPAPAPKLPAKKDFGTSAKDEPSKAKIIPLNSSIQIDEELQEDDFHVDIEEDNELNTLGIYSAEQLKEKEYKEQELKNKNKKSTSVFLMDEREKLRLAKNKIKEQNAIKMYQTNTVVELTVETPEDYEEEVVFSDSKGVLINRRQF